MSGAERIRLRRGVQSTMGRAWLCDCTEQANYGRPDQKAARVLRPWLVEQCAICGARRPDSVDRAEIDRRGES